MRRGPSTISPAGSSSSRSSRSPPMYSAASPSAASSESREPHTPNYNTPSPPGLSARNLTPLGCDGRPLGNTSPTRSSTDLSTNTRVYPFQFYPRSAFGLPESPSVSPEAARAAHDTMAFLASSQLTSSVDATHTRPSPTPSNSSTPQIYSEPPMPVYHFQPQSTAAYYPAPHHQAQILAKEHNDAPQPQTDTGVLPTIEVNRPDAHARSEPPSVQIVQGGVVYTPSVEELGLHSLSDGPLGEKPPYPLPTIIRCAILGSPRQRLTISEIFTAMEARYPWFQQAGRGWKNSVRHSLSLNKCFAKVSRPITEPGKGAYWTVDLEAGEGNKRPRKRNRKPKAKSRTVIMDDTEVMDEDEDMGTSSELSRSFSPEASGNREPFESTTLDPSQRLDMPTYTYPPPVLASNMAAVPSMPHDAPHLNEPHRRDLLLLSDAEQGSPSLSPSPRSDTIASTDVHETASPSISSHLIPPNDQGPNAFSPIHPDSGSRVTMFPSPGSNPCALLNPLETTRPYVTSGGLLTAAALGGKPRRVPLGPVGPAGEGRVRQDEDDDSD